MAFSYPVIELREVEGDLSHAQELANRGQTDAAAKILLRAEHRIDCLDDVWPEFPAVHDRLLGLCEFIRSNRDVARACKRVLAAEVSVARAACEDDDFPF